MFVQISEYKKDELINKGFCVVDDILPISLAQNIYEQFVNEQDWEHQIQNQPKHYKNRFKTKNNYLPSANEIYSAKFHRSDKLRKSLIINDIFKNYFIPLLNSLNLIRDE